MTRQTIAAFLWGVMATTIIIAVLMWAEFLVPRRSIEPEIITETKIVTETEYVTEYVEVPVYIEVEKEEPKETVPMRYPEITEEEREMLAAIVYLEARGESAEGQQAVAEVVMNRVVSDQFPDTVEGVIYQSGQFTPAKYITSTTPTTAQYMAVNAALYGENILPENVVYFSGAAQKGKEVWGSIGGHVFCYE